MLCEVVCSFCTVFQFLAVFIVDPSKESAFKVAPSKWEAVDESELEAQGETFLSAIKLLT